MIERILIVDRDANFAEELKTRLEMAGYTLTDAVTNVEMMKYLCDNRFYSAVIAEKELIGEDEVKYFMNLRRLTEPFISEIMLTSSEIGADAVLDCGFDKSTYCMKKPFEFHIFSKMLDELLSVQRAKRKKKQGIDLDALLERNVTGVMHALGIPAHIKGYQFLRTAIIKSVKDPEIINYITKSLYPDVAKAHATTPSRVERAIRHAIEVAWDRGDVDTLNAYFGYTISRQRGKPTNSEFIAMIADNLRMKMSDNTGFLLTEDNRMAMI